MSDEKTRQTTPPANPAKQREGSDGRDDPMIGKVVGGRFRVERKIGEGGMGVVYKAVQTGLEREVVVKLLSDDRIDDETSLKRFEREAKNLSKLDHSNIVTIHDFGQEGDLSYIVMEYVDGYRLDQLIEHRNGMNLSELGPIAVQILDAVGEAHRLNVVHRDLKPSNIMLTERRGMDNFVKILDFGLAKLTEGATEVTADESIVGSVPFLSPEQIKGNDARIDQRVDVYALGIVFYYALAGRKPFEGTNANVLYDQVHNAPPPLHLHANNPDDLPRDVIEVIERALRKDPDERPHDATAFMEQLFAAVPNPQMIAPPWMQSGDSSDNIHTHASPPDTGGGLNRPAGVDQPQASQDALSAPVSTSDALKQHETGSRPASQPGQPGGAEQRASRQAQSTAQVEDEDDGPPLGWIAGTAALVTLLAAGGYMTMNGQLGILSGQSAGAPSGAVTAGAAGTTNGASEAAADPTVAGGNAEADASAGSGDKDEKRAEQQPGTRKEKPADEPTGGAREGASEKEAATGAAKQRDSEGGDRPTTESQPAATSETSSEETSEQPDESSAAAPQTGSSTGEASSGNNQPPAQGAGEQPAEDESVGLIGADESESSESTSSQGESSDDSSAAQKDDSKSEDDNNQEDGPGLLPVE